MKHLKVFMATIISLIFSTHLIGKSSISGDFTYMINNNSYISIWTQEIESQLITGKTIPVLQQRIQFKKKGPAGPQLPDLCFDGRVSISPKRPKMGDEVLYSATIRNCGKIISSMFKVKLVITGPEGFHKITKNYVLPRLSPTPGSERTFYVINYRRKMSQMGAYRFAVTIDEGNGVQELNENNNKKSRAFIVQPLPDFAVYVPGVKDVHVGRKRTVTFEVRNIGPGLSPPSRLRTFLDGENVKVYSIPKLRHNEKRTFKRSHRWWWPGKKLYTVCIDCQGDVLELNENNNRKQGHVKVYAGSHFDESGIPPSACGLKISFSAPAKVKIFQKVAIVAKVKNPWSFKTPPTKLEFIIYDQPTIKMFVPELYPNQVHEIPYTVKWKTPGKRKYAARILEPGKDCPYTSGIITVQNPVLKLKK